MTRLLRYSIFALIVCAFGYNFIAEPNEDSKMSKKQRIKEALEEDFMRTYDLELGYPPYERMVEVLKQTREMQQTLAVQGRSAQVGLNPKFDERGPVDIGGRTRAIHIDLRDPERKKLWVGSVSGGLWVTEDITAADAQWKIVDDFMENLAISDIVQDPNNPLVLYAGTGELFDGVGVRGMGIFKTVDGGETWNLLESTSNTAFYYTRSLAFQASTGFVYAATRQGVQRSEDGGESWSRVAGVSLGMSGNDIYDVHVIGDEVFASSITDIARSPNGDRGTWIEITSSGSGFPTNWSRCEFDVCAKDPNVMYAVGSIGGAGSEVYKTDDGGVSWVSTGRPGGGDFTNGQAWYDLDMAIDPFDCNRAIAAGVPLFRTTTQGGNWNQLPHSSYQSSAGHVDQHKVRFDDQQQGVIYFGNDGGIWRSIDGNAQVISDKNVGYVTTQYYGCAIHPDAFSNYMLGGTQDNGTHSLNSVDISSGRRVWGGDGFLCHIDQKDPNFQMVSSQFGNWGLSTNGGASFSSGQSVNGGFLNPSDYDADDGILYTQTSDANFYRWNVKTGLLEPVNWNIPGGRVTTVAVDPYTPHRVYFGTNTGRIIRVDNAHEGETVEAEEIFRPGGTVSSVSVGYNSPDDLIATVSNYGSNNSVVVSNDGGETWLSCDGNLPDMPVRWAIFSPQNVKEALIATEAGVWSTTALNGSATQWEPPAPGRGTPIVRVDQLDWRESDLTVIAATYGRGLWTSNVFSQPAAKFDAPQVGYLGTEVIFDGSVSINADTYDWDFGDGSTSTDEAPIKTYDKIGEYQVLLTINGELSTSQRIKILPDVPLPYTDGESEYSGSFEGFEEHYGTEVFNGSTFEVGISEIPGKNGAKSGGAAMVLEPGKATYQPNTLAAFYLPEFDFSDESIYTFQFFANHSIQGTDGFNVQYSTDGGQSWRVLGKQEQGWYNINSNSLNGSAWPNNTPYFTNVVGGYTRYSTDVSFLSGEATVAFRFQFRSDGSGFHAGVAIDDVTITKYEGELETRVNLFTGDFTDGNKEITLDWSTSPEYYCQRFEIERSTNGRDFEKIADVASKGVLSDKVNNYKFKDSQGGSLFFYRIKVINENLESGYSLDFYTQTITVRRSTFDGVEVYNPGSGAKIFPNPFRDRINITFTDRVDQNVKFELFDATGRVLFSNEAFVDDVWTSLELFDVPAGVYYFSIQIGENEEEVFPLMGGF